MPVISMFYGVIVSMYSLDNQRHGRPHVHVRYQEDEAVISVPGGGSAGGRNSPSKDAPGSRMG